MSINFLIGRKMGMTRIFDDLGSDYPVTILEAGPCSITQIKTAEKDGYSSVQLGFQDKSERHLKKTEKGHFEKAGVSVKHFLFTSETISAIFASHLLFQLISTGSGIFHSPIGPADSVQECIG